MKNIIFCLIGVFLVSCSSNPALVQSQTKSQKVLLGSVHPDHVRATLRGKIPKFRRCLITSIEKTDIAVKLIFSVDKDGKSFNTGVEQADELSKTEHECLIDALNNTEFPKPIGGGSYDVKQPMKFKKRT